MCPRAHEGQVKVQYNCGSEVAYKRNASTIAECTYAGTQKVHAQALGYGVRLRGRKGPADPHGVQQLRAQDLDGLRLGGSV